MFQKLTGEDGRDGKMPVNDKSCRIRIPLDQKIHVVEMYSDQGHSLMAVGLSSGLAIISLVLDEDDALSGYQVANYPLLNHYFSQTDLSQNTSFVVSSTYNSGVSVQTDK